MRIKGFAIVLMCVLFAPLVFGQCHQETFPFPCNPLIVNQYLSIGAGGLLVLPNPDATPRITFSLGLSIFADDGLECLRGYGYSVKWDREVTDMVSVNPSLPVQAIPPDTYFINFKPGDECARVDVLIDLSPPCTEFLPTSFIEGYQFFVSELAQPGQEGTLRLEDDVACKPLSGWKGNYVLTQTGPNCEYLKEQPCDSGPFTFRVAKRFIRGDVNGDQVIDTADVLMLSDFVGLGIPQSPYDCRDAMNVDDDENIDLDDISLLAAYVAGSGPPPAPPFPACGIDLTNLAGPYPDTIRCAESGCP